MESEKNIYLIIFSLLKKDWNNILYNVNSSCLWLYKYSFLFFFFFACLGKKKYFLKNEQNISHCWKLLYYKVTF